MKNVVLILSVGLAFNVVALAADSTQLVGSFAESCNVKDPGFDWSRAIVVFQKGKDCEEQASAYCRIVGGEKKYQVQCTVNSSSGSCKTITSEVFGDKGHENSQYWADKNGDDYIDFCRIVGDGKNRYTSCRLGPEFKKEKSLK